MSMLNELVLQSSSSGGRQHLDKMGCTSNPTLLHFSRRGEPSHTCRAPLMLTCCTDQVPSVELPTAPASSATSLLQVGAMRGTTLNVPAECTAIASSRTSEDAHTATSSHASKQKVVEKAKALPPLTFPSLSEAHTISLPPRAPRVVVPRSSKEAHIYNAQAGRNRFSRPFRIFSGFFRRSASTIPTVIDLPTPLSPSALSEKGAQLYAAPLEGRGPVVVQLQLQV